MPGSTPGAGENMGQTHGKHREPECKLVTMKKDLSLTPRHFQTATPPAQLSLGTSSILNCLSLDLQQLAALDGAPQQSRKIDNASFAASKLFSTPIQVMSQARLWHTHIK